MDCTPSTPDFTLLDCGSIILVEPQNKPAGAFLRWHTDGLWHGKALAVEPRYLDGLLDLLVNEGFTLS